MGHVLCKAVVHGITAWSAGWFETQTAVRAARRWRMCATPTCCRLARRGWSWSPVMLACGESHAGLLSHRTKVRAMLYTPLMLGCTWMS
jgi:hypothetical protein